MKRETPAAAGSAMAAREDQAGRGNLEAAVADWSRDLGTAHVLSTASELGRYARSTISRPVRALAVLRPGDREQVIAAVKTAARCRLPLHPISRGKNWGYGDACPVTEDNVILHLGRMDRILEVDADLAYAVIEPGVTQGQLSDYLLKKEIPLWPDSHTLQCGD